jgi:sugar O-acyltransferase (sialic acid O-acetyltransferase NeuD family)
MNNLAIYGAGGFGREVCMMVNQINQHKMLYKVIGYFDDSKQKGCVIGHHEVLGGIKELNSYPEDIFLVIALGNPVAKSMIFLSIENDKVKFPVLIHPSCIIGTDNVTIGEGSIICAGSILTVDITIGNHVILNLGCTVGHDTKIGSYSSLMPSVNVSGEVELGEGVYCGTGVRIINQLKVGNNTIVGAGGVVSKSLPSNCTAVGIPAKPIKYHNE